MLANRRKGRREDLPAGETIRKTAKEIRGDEMAGSDRMEAKFHGSQGLKIDCRTAAKRRSRR